MKKIISQFLKKSKFNVWGNPTFYVILGNKLNEKRFDIMKNERINRQNFDSHFGSTYQNLGKTHLDYLSISQFGRFSG